MLRRVFAFWLRLASIPVVVAGMVMFRMSIRVMYLRVLSFLGGIGLKLFPSIYASLDAQNVKYGSGLRVKEKYLHKEAFNEFLKEAERLNMSAEKILSQLKSGGGIETDVLATSLAEVFDYADNDIEVAVQYSGGCDSTLAAILAARYFRKVHLLSFHNPFIRHKEKSERNAEKITAVFGPDKVTHSIIDTSTTFRKILFDRYLTDLIRHRTFVLGVGCLACKLSFDINIIRYAREHKISMVIDGADLSVKSQLSQGDEAILEQRNLLYARYGIDFKHPVARFTNNAHELFVIGEDLEPPQIFYAEQPECKGNQFLNEIYDRFYFLPRYGIEVHSEKGQIWLKDKLPVCIECIDESV